MGPAGILQEFLKFPQYSHRTHGHGVLNAGEIKQKRIKYTINAKVDVCISLNRVQESCMEIPMGFPWGFPRVWVWDGYGDCDESPWVLWEFCGNTHMSDQAETH